MSTSGLLFSNASLKAANAQPYSVMKNKLDPLLLQALKDMDFEFMTPVQSKVLEGLPSFRSDCLVQATTGTGKTTAFLLPAIQSTLRDSPPRGQVSILIMSPTRELALQIAAEASRLVARLRKPLEVHTAFGGTGRATALDKFRRGDPKIVVATPGRLNDYMTEDDIRDKFSGIKTLVLDEADRMLDQGFLPSILDILRALPPKNAPNIQWQGMCFSATIPPTIHKILSQVLDKDHVSISTIDSSEPSTLAKVPQFSVVIPKAEDTLAALLSLIKEEIHLDGMKPKIIVFGTTANLVKLYAKLFKNLVSLKVDEIHSRMNQPARTKVTAAFKAAENGILFATDVIGRGMDFPDISLVIQVGLPADTDSYTHRVGRTARAGKDGRAIILLTQRESFFLRKNPQFPIQPYPASEKVRNDRNSTDEVKTALHSIDPESKQKAYSAYLGFMKVYMNQMQMKPADLVKSANDFALNGLETGEVPEMEKKTIGKMGLKGVPGIRYAPATSQESGPNNKRNIPTEDHTTGSGGPSRRLRHQ